LILTNKFKKENYNMNLIQFELPKKGRRVGLINEDEVVDLTNINTAWTHTYYLFLEANRNGKTITAYLEGFPLGDADTISYDQLLTSYSGDPNGWILPDIKQLPTRGWSRTGRIQPFGSPE
jgi:hypothetical protein